MKNFENIQLLTLANTLVSLLSAFVLGSIVGFERQFRQRTAGLRTNALVAVGAAIFVDMAFRVGGADGGARVISYVVSGVGFLGAGAIMREGGSIRGLNTAATLWARPPSAPARARRCCSKRWPPRLRAGREHLAAAPGQPYQPPAGRRADH